MGKCTGIEYSIPIKGPVKTRLLTRDSTSPSERAAEAPKRAARMDPAEEADRIGLAGGLEARTHTWRPEQAAARLRRAGSGWWPDVKPAHDPSAGSGQDDPRQPGMAAAGAAEADAPAPARPLAAAPWPAQQQFMPTHCATVPQPLDLVAANHASVRQLLSSVVVLRYLSPLR